MPNIHEYSAPQLGIRPSEVGIVAQEQTARTVGRLAAQEADQLAGVARGKELAAREQEVAIRNVAEGAGGVADAVATRIARHQEQQETTKFYADYAQLANGITTQWNATRNQADPNDPGVAEKFNHDVLAPALEQFGSGYHTLRGQQLVASESGRLMEHMLTQQKADMSTAAGEAAVLNIGKTSNLNADTLSKDPTSLEFVQDATKNQIATLKTNPYLTAEQSAHLDTLGQDMLRKNARAAFVGMADKNPVAARAALAGGYGKEYLTEADRVELDNHAKSMQEFGQTQQRAAQAEQRRQTTEANNARANQIYSGAVQPDGSFQPGNDYFANLKELASRQDADGNVPDPALLHSLYTAGERALREPPIQHSDPDLLQHFSDRAILPTGNPDVLSYQQIFDAQSRGLLSDRDANRLRTDVTEMAKDPARQDALKQFQTFVNSQRNVIVRPAIQGLPAAKEQYTAWGAYQVQARQAFDTAYASGQWRALLDPQNAQYLGKLAMSPVYQNPTKTAVVNPPATQQPGTQAQPEDFLGLNK